MVRLSTALGQPVWENLVLVCEHLVSIPESPMQISHPVNKNYMFIYIYIISTEQCNVHVHLYIKFCPSWVKSQFIHVRIYTVFQVLPFFLLVVSP